MCNILTASVSSVFICFLSLLSTTLHLLLSFPPKKTSCLHRSFHCTLASSTSVRLSLLLHSLPSLSLSLSLSLLLFLLFHSSFTSLSLSLSLSLFFCLLFFILLSFFFRLTLFLFFPFYFHFFFLLLTLSSFVTLSSFMSLSLSLSLSLSSIFLTVFDPPSSFANPSSFNSFSLLFLSAFASFVSLFPDPLFPCLFRHYFLFSFIFRFPSLVCAYLSYFSFSFCFPHHHHHLPSFSSFYVFSPSFFLFSSSVFLTFLSFLSFNNSSSLCLSCSQLTTLIFLYFLFISLNFPNYSYAFSLYLLCFLSRSLPLNFLIHYSPLFRHLSLYTFPTSLSPPYISHVTLIASFLLSS
ncbi:unnamed protein product [Acanthosepion pharaonis]|uniref:Uncharacterized protein n=1 Tax=Acanthosepion pharaonis TaxID=158019 RepID=A0A812CW88_ACAPH|nr:unnamed protein product [Sepia pharaonis]